MEDRKLFVSYSKHDSVFVRQLADDLKRAGLRVWIDMWEIKVGDSIVDKINHGIRASDYLIAVVSKNSVASKWVAEELNAATVRKVQERQGFILPVVIDDVELPPLLSHVRYADFRERYDDGLQALLDVLTPAVNRMTKRDERRRDLNYMAERLKEVEKAVSDFAYDVGYDSDSDPDDDDRGLCDRLSRDYEDAVERYRDEFKETYDPHRAR